MADISIINKDNTDYNVKDAAGRLALAEVENKGAKNLFKITAVSEVKQGVRFTVNSDGTVTVTRESAGTSNAFLTLGQFTGESGITYTLSGCPATGSDSTYYMYIGSTFRDYGSGVSREGGTERSIVIYVDKTYSPDNLVFKPMICTKAEWDISQAYVPYGKTNAELTGDISTLSTENTSQQAEINYAVNAGAKNLLNVTASSGVLNTATIDIADDGSIHISGQPTSNGAYVLSSGIDLVIPENAYILSMGAEAGDTKMALSLRRKGTTQYVDLYHAESRIIPSGTYDRAHIYLYSDTDYDTVVYPMIRPDAITDSTYEPYAPTNRELYEEKIGIEDVYGPGAKIVANTNFNDIKTHGLYYSTSTQDIASFTNCPVSAQFTLSVKFGSQAVFQEIQPMSKAEIMYRYVRMFTNGTWSPWYKFEGTEVT